MVVDSDEEEGEEEVYQSSSDEDYDSDSASESDSDSDSDDNDDSNNPSLQPQKSVVFSQFSMYLDLLEVRLNQHKLKFTRLDGSMTHQQRSEVRIYYCYYYYYLFIKWKAGGKKERKKQRNNSYLVLFCDFLGHSKLQIKSRSKYLLNIFEGWWCRSEFGRGKQSIYDGRMVECK